ncbi:MAG: exonuclease subunit SbcD [Gemmatimonas sp.]|nr:exonuclease subunit SbcD [Gemmatimonas sp.]
MKILHTGDWHVGRSLRGRSRIDEQKVVLEEIVEITREEAVDLVLVVGDIFDSSAPTAEVEELVYKTLLDLAGTGAEVLVIAGNHDSPYRLKAIRPLLLLTRVHTVPFPAAPREGGVIDFQTKSGEVARVAVLPFLSQRGVVRADRLMAGEADEHAQAYGDRCRRILAQLCEGFDTSTVNLVVAHLAVVGGQVGGGERQAHTVFDYFASPQIFPANAHYVALGHLHRSQSIPGACPIWYCGSPLQLDFGDDDEERSVLLVEVHPSEPALVRPRTLSGGRSLQTISGTLAQLETQRESVGEAFLRVIVHENPRAGLADEVRDMFPNAIDVSVRVDESRSTADLQDDRAWSRAPAELFEEYLRERSIEDPRLLRLFDELLEEVNETEAA